MHLEQWTTLVFSDLYTSVLFVEYIESMFFFVFWSSVGFGANCVDLSDLIFIFNFCATLTPFRDDVKVQKQSIDPPNANYYLCCSSDTV